MNFESPLSKAITYLFPGDCFDEIFHKFHFIHGRPVGLGDRLRGVAETCLPIVVSRVLGLAITLGSLMGACVRARHTCTNLMLQSSCHRSSRSGVPAARRASVRLQCCSIWPRASASAATRTDNDLYLGARVCARAQPVQPMG
jgi:hypothetical protein